MIIRGSIGHLSLLLGRLQQQPLNACIITTQILAATLSLTLTTISTDKSMIIAAGSMPLNACTFTAHISGSSPPPKQQQQQQAVAVNTSYYINRLVHDNRSKQAAALTLYTTTLS